MNEHWFAYIVICGAVAIEAAAFGRWVWRRLLSVRAQRQERGA